MHERAFVLIPLADLVPDLVHPVLGKTVRQLLAAVDQSGVHLYVPSAELLPARKPKKT
jgi:7,8-dihydro-6-hydroxymethylpterin-pyrophosphokinase